MSVTTVERERVAARLLKSSERLSYDPVTDIDWAAPVDPLLPASPLHRLSLYGTRLWDEMTDEQRLELSRREFASVASVGLWFEMCLMQSLLRHSYDRDPHASHVQYALTEIGDETRHSVMFARAAQKLAPGARYRPHRAVHELGRFWKSTAAGPSMFASVLVAEETLDRMQREMLADDGLLPFSREVCRIHVTEEARHVSYAREAVKRDTPELSRKELEYHRLLTALTAVFVVESFLDPAVYAHVGLDVARAKAEAAANPFYRETRLWSAEKVTGFLEEQGLIGGPTRRIWERAGLVR